jgi:transposase-like protein
MDEEIRRLRTEAQQLAQAKVRSQVRYPSTFRRTAVGLAHGRLRQGGSVARLAQEIGVSTPTLTKWLRSTTRPMLRPVTVTAAPTAEHPAVSRAVLITPQGVRVEALDRDTLIAVLQALG